MVYNNLYILSDDISGIFKGTLKSKGLTLEATDLNFMTNSYELDE